MHSWIQVLALCLLLPAHASAQTVEAFADREIVPEGGIANILIRGSSISAGSSVEIDLEVSPENRAGLSAMSIMLTPTMSGRTTAEATVRVSVRQNKARQKEDETFSIMLSSGDQTVEISSRTLSFTVPPNDLSVPFDPSAETETIDGVSRLSTVHGTVSVEDLGGRKSFIVSSPDVRVTAVSRIDNRDSGIVTMSGSGMNSFDVVLSIAEDAALSIEDAAGLVMIHHLDALDPSARMSAQISAGEIHTCAVRTDSRLRCWGRDSVSNARQVSGANEDREAFLSVVAGHRHTCAVRIDSKLECWGGQTLGVVGPNRDRAEDQNFLAVSAGQGHTCAVTAEGAVRCWDDDSFTDLDGKFDEASAGGEIFLSVSSGLGHACAVRIDRSLRCYGNISDGRAPSSSAGPYLSVSAGTAHTCALRTDGRPECWARDDSRLREAKTPPEGMTFLSVDAGTLHTCGIRTDRTLQCWGMNTESWVSGPNSASGSFLVVSAGSNYTCAVTTGGEPECYGLDRPVGFSEDSDRTRPETAGFQKARISPDTRWLFEKTRVLGELEDLRLRIRVYLEGALR